jgi:hypothetical protein
MAHVNEHRLDSLKYQFRVLGLVTRSDWATSLDKSIAYEIIDNYIKPKRASDWEKGNSRASLRYLEEATGATRPNVIASTRRLIENGPFSVERKGSGTRETEYKIHFHLVHERPSGIAGNTTSNCAPSGIVDNTAAVLWAIPNPSYL